MKKLKIIMPCCEKEVELPMSITIIGENWSKDGKKKKIGTIELPTECQCKGEEQWK